MRGGCDGFVQLSGSSLLLQGMLLGLIAFLLANALSGIKEFRDSSVIRIYEVLMVIVSAHFL